MKPTRLFQTIVVAGASLTTGAVPVALVGAMITTTGCDQPSDVRSWPDIGIPPDMARFWEPIDATIPIDFSTPEDLTPPDGGPDAK